MPRLTSNLHLFPFVVAALWLLPSPATNAQDKQQPASGKAKAATRFLDEAIVAIDKHSTIKAKLTEVVSMGTRQFVANGTYQQAKDYKVRVEIKVKPIRELTKEEKPLAEGQEAPKLNSVLHVSDGQVLWTEFVIDGESRAERRNLREVVAAFEKSDSAKDLMPDLGVGGVPALLKSLRKRMVFDGMREQTIDGKPFVVLQGHWTVEQIQKFDPKETDPDPVFRAGFLPEYVRIFFEKKTMFPRRILYLKRHQSRQQRMARPLVTLDLTNVVLNSAIAPETFRFEVTDRTVQVDLTKETIKTYEVLRQNREAADKKSP